MGIIEAYKTYLSDPHLRTIKAFFMEAVNSKEDYSNELFELHHNFEPIELGDFEISTGGSTATPNTYEIGPLFFDTREVIERFIRSPVHPEWPRVYIRGLFPSEMGRVFWNYTPPSDSIAVDISRDDFVNKIIAAAKKNIDKDGGCVLYTFCRTAQTMSQKPYLLDWLESMKDKVVLTTSYADAFYNTKPFLERGIYCNDQMINWHTGVAFYTCPHNRRHLIANIHAVNRQRMYNLFNPNHKVSHPIDDHIELDDSTCPCGRHFVIKRFVPHFTVGARYPDGSMLHDLALAEKFDTEWYSMQFLTKDDGKLYCYWLAEQQPKKEIIEQHFGLPVKMIANTMFRRRGKAPIFWGRPDLLTEEAENIL